jgi:hypothetical protein
MKKILFLALLIINLSSVMGQNADFDLNILMSPSVVQLNANGILNVSTCNNGSTSIVANSLRITVSVGTNAEILGLEPGSDSRWTILSLTTGTNNTIQLKNTGGTMTPAAGANPCANINLTVKGTVNGGPSTITGNIAYIAGANPLLGGAPSATQGNSSTANDNSNTSLTVTSVLPVKLTSFDASVSKCATELKWSSTSEINFNYYVVEYSIDGINYNTVTTIQSKGDNRDYTLLHQPKKGKAFYRLKLVDKNNNYSYSKINLVNSDCEISSISVFPNPVQDVLNVNISNFESGAIKAVLFDESGRQVLNRQFINGFNQVNVSMLSKGNYTLSIYKQNSLQSIKIIKR